MMQVIHCVNCNGTSIGLNAISVDVTLKRHSHCEHCHEMKTDQRTFFFCSTKCFVEYLDKVSRGEADFKWKEYRIGY